MKCKQCGKRYHLDWAQPGPGGSSSPGYFFWGFILLIILTILLYWYEISLWHWVTLGIGVFVLIQVPIAYSDCTDEDYSGKLCPECKTVNRAFWWSI
jgi:hypothetical protein